MSGARLVAVLGYSDAGGDLLHPVCAARLSKAQEVTRPDDIVLLSGWARSGYAGAEADAMAAAWSVPAGRIVLDRSARSTLGNALAVARATRRHGITDVVLVTSSWHARRASLLVRAALRGTGTSVRLAPSVDAASRRARARELACWGLAPLLAVAAARAS